MKSKENTLVKHRDSIYSEQITNIRVLAILIVVFGHSIILYSSAWNLYSTINKVQVLDYIKDIINLIQMPLCKQPLFADSRAVFSGQSRPY